MRNVVVINENGQVIGVEQYDETNDAGRNQRRQDAANAIANRLGIAPAKMGGNRGIRDEHGNEWGTMVGNIQIGMVEIGFGKWGFMED